jgi:hypothetical protein
MDKKTPAVRKIIFFFGKFSVFYPEIYLKTRRKQQNLEVKTQHKNTKSFAYSPKCFEYLYPRPLSD